MPEDSNETLLEVPRCAQSATAISGTRQVLFVFVLRRIQQRTTQAVAAQSGGPGSAEARLS
jgi:hypothetical protein